MGPGLGVGVLRFGELLGGLRIGHDVDEYGLFRCQNVSVVHSASRIESL